MFELAQLRVERLHRDDVAETARWEAFVESCPQATFFHRAGWQPILNDIFGHRTDFLYAHKGGEILGVLPLGEIRSRFFGHSLTSLPFAVYGGAAATSDEARDALQSEAQALARSLGAEHLELRHFDRRHPDWPEQDLYVTFRKEILTKEEDNMLAIPRKQRAMVRKGIKLGLTSAVDHSAERFFRLYADNVHRHGTPALPFRYFQALLDTFGEDCEVLTVCSVEGKPVSSVMSFYFRDEVLPYYAGDDQTARDLAANDFKYWELMRRACARGLKVFDYGRSKVGTGPYAFKKNWGFEPTRLHYEFCLLRRDGIPQNNPNNPKYRLLIEGWKRMPLPLANWLGPFIVRNLG